MAAHLVTYKRRWLRRVMIVVQFPKGLWQSIRGTFTAAKRWWNWDGAVDPERVWMLNDGTTVPLPIFKD